MIVAINGVSYPADVENQDSLLNWISTIDRETEVTVQPSSVYHKVYKYAYFYNDDTKKFAETIVCQQMAMSLFSHLIKAPKSKLVWRTKPEFGASPDAIPSDLSKAMDRKQMDAATGWNINSPVPLDVMKKALGKEDWSSDFVTDTIFPVAAPLGTWWIFKSYMRYSIMIGNDVIPHPIERDNG